MIDIAICDDEHNVCNSLETSLLAFSQKNKILINTCVFYDAKNLLEYLEKGNHFDIIFVDIEMQGLNGIEFGSYLRKIKGNDYTKIIFISWHEKYAMKLFKYRPDDFLVKPIEKRLNEANEHLKRVYQEIITNNTFFSYKIGRSYFKIDVKEIMYFVSENRVVKMYMKNTSIIIYCKLDQVEEDIRNDKFLRIHKSILVNSDYVLTYDCDRLILENGVELRISKAYRKSVRDYYYDNWRSW